MEVKDLLSVGLILAVLGIAVSYAINVVADVGDDFTANSLEANATTATNTALDKIPDKLGLIVTVIIAAVIIGILLRYLYIR